jgi:hypothetical protein
MFMPSRMFIYPIIPETGFVVMCGKHRCKFLSAPNLIANIGYGFSSHLI